MSKSSKRGRPRSILPSYRLHKASGQAVVTIRGKTHYLGVFGSDDSRRKYGEFLWFLNPVEMVLQFTTPCAPKLSKFSAQSP